jgi:hypothetical protein
MSDPAASIVTMIEVTDVDGLGLSVCPVPARMNEDRVMIQLSQDSTRVCIVGTRAELWALLDTWTGQLDEIDDEDLIY